MFRDRAANSERLSRFTFKRRERKSGRQIGSLDSRYLSYRNEGGRDGKAVTPIVIRFQLKLTFPRPDIRPRPDRAPSIPAPPAALSLLLS